MLSYRDAGLEELIVTVTSNYRPIALTTIFSKVLEHVMLNRMSDHLHTSDNQFGFKQRHSTLMPVLLLKEVLNFYRDNGSNVDYMYAFSMLAKHSIESTIIFYLTNRLSVTFLVIYYVCCCVGIVPNLAVFYGQVSFPKPLTSQMVLDKEVCYHLSYLLCTSMTLAINCKWLMLVVMLAVVF